MNRQVEGVAGEGRAETNTFGTHFPEKFCFVLFEASVPTDSILPGLFVPAWNAASSSGFGAMTLLDGSSASFA